MKIFSGISRRPYGFTIAELAIVILIIGILATITFATYTGVEKRARDSKRVDDIAFIVRALENYYLENKSYPISSGSSTLGATWSSTADSSWNTLSNTLKSYTDGAMPTDPLTQAGQAIGSYNYAYFSNPLGASCGSGRNQMFLLVYKLEASAQSNTLNGLCTLTPLAPYAGASNYRMTRL